MKVSENVIHRCVADEDMLVPIGEAAMDMNGLYVLTAYRSRDMGYAG